MDDLRRIAKERGYNEGWVGVQYGLKKKKFEAIAKRKALEEFNKSVGLPPPPAPVPVGNEWEENLDF
jgi:hypothetical protein